MQKHGFAPKQTLYIGDTVHDYNTARDLGVDCILFSGGQQSPKLLKQCGVPVYDSFADITKRLIRWYFEEFERLKQKNKLESH